VWHRVFPASWDACSQREATVNIYGLQKVHDRTKCLEEESSLLGDNPSLPDCLPASPYFGPIPFFAGCRAGSPCSRDAAHTKRGPCRGPGWASCQGPSATISPEQPTAPFQVPSRGVRIPGVGPLFVQFSISSGTCDWEVRRPVSLQCSSPRSSLDRIQGFVSWTTLRLHTACLPPWLLG
jgi:hypothetical protein